MEDNFEDFSGVITEFFSFLIGCSIHWHRSESQKQTYQYNYRTVNTIIYLFIERSERERDLIFLEICQHFNNKQQTDSEYIKIISWDYNLNAYMRIGQWHFHIILAKFLQLYYQIRFTVKHNNIVSLIDNRHNECVKFSKSLLLLNWENKIRRPFWLLIWTKELQTWIWN